MIQSLVAWFKNSIIIKIFLGVLMISFGVWGVGDFLTPGMDPNLAIKVGTVEVAIGDLRRKFDLDLDHFKEMSGGKRIDSPEIKRALLARTVNDITFTATADAYAEDLGLVMTDDRLRETIRDTAGFKDANGAFNQLQYQQILAANHITERTYLGMVASDLRRQAMLQPILANSASPAAMVDSLTSYRAETRIADTLLISAAAVPAPPPPDDAALKKVYDANIARFTAPEYRKVSALVIYARDLVDPASFDDAQVKAYYDENIDRYRDAEKRSISQLVFETKEQADAAKALAGPGDHLTDIARKAKIDPPVSLGELKKKDSLVAMIGPAYDLPEGQISDVIHTDLGWHLFEVTSIIPEQSVPLAMVEKNIRTAMAEDKGTDALYEASTTIEDGAAGGTSLNDLAAKVGGKVMHVDAIDRQGHDPSGSPIPGIVDYQRFVETAFTLPTGGTSSLMEIPKGYYLVSVDAVTPPTPKPLDTVRKDVLGVWEKQERTRIAQDLATKIASGIGAGSMPDEAAKDKVATYAQLGPITRFGDGLNAAHMVDKSRISPELLAKLFAAKPGDVVEASVAGGAVVARLREVVAPDAVGDAQKAREEMAKAVSDGVADDLAIEMSHAFAVRFPAKVNTKSVESLVTSSSSD